MYNAPSSATRSGIFQLSRNDFYLHAGIVGAVITNADMLRRIATLASLVLLALLPCVARTATLNAVEYFHAGFGHYFVTAEPDKVAPLDAGTPQGWARIGLAFSAASGPEDRSQPVCRLFSAAFAPRSSHFYTPFASECASLRAGTAWTFESIAFYLTLPSPEGTCPAGTTTIYRRAEPTAPTLASAC